MPFWRHLLRPVKLLIAMYLSVWAAWSYATPALDLWDIWQLALARDPIYAAQRANTQANQEQIEQARAKLLPAISAVTSIAHNDNRRVSGFDRSRQNNPNQWQLRLSQPLLDLAAVARLERSRYLAAIALLDLEEAKNSLFVRISQAYFNVLSAQDSLKSLEAQYNAVEQQLRLAQYQFELGGATITDTYEAQSRLDLVTNQRISTENALQIYKNQLSRIVGQSIQVLAPLNPNVKLPAPEPNRMEPWLERAQQGNLSIAKANLASTAQKQQLKANKREHAPTLSLQAQSGSQSHQGIYGPSSGPRALSSSISLELAIPIYEGGAVSSRVRENALLLQQSHYEQENARREATEDISTYFSSVHSSLQQVKALRAAERTSQASVQANQTAYEIGARNNIDVLDAQQQLYETQRALAKARYDALLYSIKLKKAAGLLQESDIADINRLLIPAL